MRAECTPPVARCGSFFVAGATLLLAGCATAPRPPSRPVLDELVPAGTLRTQHIVATPLRADLSSPSSRCRLLLLHDDSALGIREHAVALPVLA